MTVTDGPAAGRFQNNRNESGQAARVSREEDKKIACEFGPVGRGYEIRTWRDRVRQVVLFAAMPTAVSAFGNRVLRHGESRARLPVITRRRRAIVNFCWLIPEKRRRRDLDSLGKSRSTLRFPAQGCEREYKNMAGTATIVIVRNDLSIAGVEDDAHGPRRGDAERRFFTLVREKRPDVVVFDLRGAAGEGVAGIAKVRERTGIPIVAICDVEDPAMPDYRLAGAVECLPAPIDIVLFNKLIQQIISTRAGVPANPLPASELVSVAGMTFRPYEKRLSLNGSSISLTTAENRLLCHLVSRPRMVCRREEISEILYGRHRPTSDRAIDVIVTRLRKKLTELRGTAGQDLIKTEFREGYMFVGAVSSALEPPAPGVEGL